MTLGGRALERVLRALGWRPTLRLQLVFGYSVLLGSIAIFMYWYFPARLKREATMSLAEKARSVSDMTAYGLSAALLFDDLNAVAEVFRAARESPDVRYLVVVRSDGRLVNPFELADAIGAEYADFAAGPVSPDGSIYRTASPVFAGADTIGTLYVGLSLDRLHSDVQQSRRHIAVVSLIVFGAGLAGVVAISFLVAAPLRRIVRVVERVSDGDLEERVGSTSADEIGYLARSFDAMVEKLGAAYAELRATNRDLEGRVDERTRELRHEIDERRHAEAQLRDSEQRFRTMFESAAMGIALIAPDETIIEVNPALLEMFGRAREQVIGRSLMDAIRTDATAEVLQDFRRLLAGEENRLSGAVQLTIGDVTVWTHAVISAVHDADGRVQFALAMIENISEQRQLAERLRQAQKLEAVGRLAGGVAHDFNNLLTTINGTSALVMDELGDAEWLREDIQQIQHAGERAASLTRQLLAFSRQQVLQPRVLDLNGVVRETATMLRRLIGEDIRLDLDLASDLSAILADPGQVGQVIMNLAVNARDAMPQGGELRIRTTSLTLDDAIAARHGLATGAYVRLTVQDTGHGMDEATMQNIFEPFFTTKEVGKGTGLGLATVYGIVQQTGGAITVESEPGRGASFHVLLPVTSDRDAGEEVVVSTHLPGGSETILLVEDEEPVRRLVARVLRKGGYDVIESRDGLDALGRVRRHPGTIHAVITDVVMPNLSGPQLVAQLYRDRPGLRVLYMSGYTRTEIDQQGLSEDRFGFIQKPMSPRALAEAVRAMLDAPIEATESPRRREPAIA